MNLAKHQILSMGGTVCFGIAVALLLFVAVGPIMTKPFLESIALAVCLLALFATVLFEWARREIPK
jgi:hypothetical protein